MTGRSSLLLVLAAALIGIAPSASLAQRPFVYPMQRPLVYPAQPPLVYPAQPPAVYPAQYPVARPWGYAAYPLSYMVLKAGGYSPDQDWFDPDSGFAGEIAIGRYLLPVLAVEFGVGYLESRETPDGLPGGSTLEIVPVTLTGRAIMAMGPIEPYGEIGIGAYMTQIEVNGDLGNFSGSTENAIGLHVGGGVNFAVTPLVFLGFEGRYVWVEPTFDGDDIDLNGFTLTANLGFRF